MCFNSQTQVVSWWERGVYRWVKNSESFLRRNGEKILSHDGAQLDLHHCHGNKDAKFYLIGGGHD